MAHDTPPPPPPGDHWRWSTGPTEVQRRAVPQWESAYVRGGYAWWRPVKGPWPHADAEEAAQAAMRDREAWPEALDGAATMLRTAALLEAKAGTVAKEATRLRMEAAALLYDMSQALLEGK